MERKEFLQKIVGCFLGVSIIKNIEHQDKKIEPHLWNGAFITPSEQILYKDGMTVFFSHDGKNWNKL